MPVLGSVARSDGAKRTSAPQQRCLESVCSLASGAKMLTSKVVTRVLTTIFSTAFMLGENTCTNYQRSALIDQVLQIAEELPM